ncbi:hypothetical protein [Curtobacterium ammoniigenes]|uniref:hypothetical protein n=1 Tax=Curtobacterium ammoniigenes TaxID=395387 RepID=UPI00082D7061|nr:hypothetical protein [Curtobacterium ammoniigenes]
MTTPEDTIGRTLQGEERRVPQTRREARTAYRAAERRQARGLPFSSTGARSLRQAAQPGGSLGTGYLAIGAAWLLATEASLAIVFFLVHWPLYVDPWAPAAAWVLFLVAGAGVLATIMRYGERLTGPVFALICLVLACVVALDFIGVWPEHQITHTASASVSAAFALVPITTLRPAREIIVAVAVLGGAFVAMAVLSTPLTPVTLPGVVALVSLVVLPPTVATFVVHRFRQFVQRELDRTLVQSTVNAPQYAVGMLASDELTRLDLAAEKLLDAVANGTDPLPLSAASASIAASLATELRLHLIEGRRETWLHHAITESDHLGRAVSVADPAGLAGHLTAPQRDGLLQAIWQMVGDAKIGQHGGALVEVTFGPVGAAGHPVSDDTMDVPIVLDSRGVPRRRLGAAAWQALQQIGPYTDTVRDGVLHVVVHCVVDRHPAM